MQNMLERYWMISDTNVGTSVTWMKDNGPQFNTDKFVYFSVSKEINEMALYLYHNPVETFNQPLEKAPKITNV